MSDNTDNGGNEIKDSSVQFKTDQWADFRATLLRMTQLMAVFEVYNPSFVVRLSEVLADFRIVVGDRTLYAGKAVVHNVLNTGTAVVCEVTLEDESWMDLRFVSRSAENGELRFEFNRFLNEWQKLFRVVPEHKLVLADFQSFLADARLWLDQVELEIRSSPSGDRSEMEARAVEQLSEPVIRSIDSFIEQFEAVAATVPRELEPVHRAYLRRQLHPYLLSSPFAYRTFHKPLGYAGDYEMVSMMLRSSCEGSTLFSKIINVWLLDQLPAKAHRNRVAYLKRKLIEETVRVKQSGHPCRIFSLGCGPAGEVQGFLRENHLCDDASFTLVDFNKETLDSLREEINAIKTGFGRRTQITLVKKSVQQIIKDAAKIVQSPERQYDYVYCAGLFDYLTDSVCQRLMDVLYDMVAPGGLLLATNVSDALNSTRPFRYSMEYILDWHLIYRNGTDLARMAPKWASPEDVRVISEDTGVNVVIEVRKPRNA